MRELSLLQFIGVIEAAKRGQETAMAAALTRAAKIVEAEAKAEIGAYQDRAGPFEAWSQLADSTQEERSRLGFPANEPLLRTGALRDSIDHRVEVKGNAGEAVIGSTSEIAVFQELGTDKIPPRSFLGGALVRKTDEVVNTLGRGAVEALTGTGGQRLLP